MDDRDSFRPMRVVPDFRGLGFVEARALGGRAEVTPADPDPDAAPISARWWNTALIVAAQNPGPGTRIPQWNSVAVTLAAPGEPVGAVVAPHPSPALDAEATPPGSGAGA